MNIKRFIKWAAVNAALAWLLYLGLVENVDGARYVALFVIWLGNVAAFLALNSETRQCLAAEGRAVPEWLSWLAAGGITGALVWHGYFVTGAFYLVASAIVSHLRSPEVKP